MTPEKVRRNYHSLYDGLRKINCEAGSCTRGALANGLSLFFLYGTISPLYDFLKEYYYYFFGPTIWLRPTILVPTIFLGTALSLPFDNIKTRLHNMHKLPDGRLPYNGTFDAFLKAIYYESSYSKYSNIFSFGAGFVPAFLRNYFTVLIGVYLSDIAFSNNYEIEEFVEYGSYNKNPYIKHIPHEPYNRFETLDLSLKRQPSTTFVVGKSGDSFDI